MSSHVEQLRHLVVELEVGRFRPEHSGQLGSNVALERLRNAELHAPRAT